MARAACLAVPVASLLARRRLSACRRRRGRGGRAGGGRRRRRRRGCHGRRRRRGGGAGGGGRSVLRLRDARGRLRAHRVTGVTGVTGAGASRLEQAAQSGAVGGAAASLAGASPAPERRFGRDPVPSAMPRCVGRRREQARDQRAAGDGDREQQRGDQRSFRLMFSPLSRRQLPQGTIGRREVRLEIEGVKLSSFKLKLVAYFVLLSLVPLAATYWGFSTVAGAGESRQVTPRQEAGLRAALALYAEQADRAQAQAEQLARSRPLQRALERRDRRRAAADPRRQAVALRRRHRRSPRRRRAAARRSIPGRRRHRHAPPGRGRGDGPARRRARRASPAAVRPSTPATFSSCSRDRGSWPRCRRSAGASPFRPGEARPSASAARAIAHSSRRRCRECRRRGSPS